MHITDEQWKALDRDISDRRGLKWEWSDIDEDVKIEIRKAWDQILFPKSQPADDVVERIREIITSARTLKQMAEDSVAIARDGYVPAHEAVCSECKAPCTDHDLIGNQTELGFPKYWCWRCTNLHLAEDENKQLKQQLVGSDSIGDMLSRALDSKNETVIELQSRVDELEQQLATMYTKEQVEKALAPITKERINEIWESRKLLRDGNLCDYGAIGPVVNAELENRLARLAAPKPEQERVTIKLEKWSNNEQRYTIYVDGKPFLSGFPTEEEAKRYITLMGGVGIPKPEPTPQEKVEAILVAALKKLSTLGNGEYPGNSIGNEIAQKALTDAIRLHEELAALKGGK